MHERYRIAAVGGTCLLIGFGFAKAQSSAAALDPPRVAPHIFETVLDNDRVRVLKITERGGDTQPLHRRAARVVVHLNSCGWVEEREDGSTTMVSYGPGDVYWREAALLGGQRADFIQDCLSLAIELKDD